MQLQMGSAVVSTAAVGVPPTRRQIGEWDLLPHLFGETPNRATGTVALPFSDCIVPAQGEGTAGVGSSLRRWWLGKLRLGYDRETADLAPSPQGRGTG